MHKDTVDFLGRHGITVLNDAYTGQHVLALDCDIEADNWVDSRTTNLLCLPGIVGTYTVALSYGSEGQVHRMDDFHTGQQFIDAVIGTIYRVCWEDRKAAEDEARRAAEHARLVAEGAGW